VYNPYKLTQRFGYDPSYPYNGGNHTGVDYTSPSLKIIAPQDSKVTVIARENASGNYLVLENGLYRDFFGHIKDGGYLVTVGQQVKQGQEIAIMGRTGEATGVHVHHGLRLNGILVDAEKYINGGQAMADKITPDVSKILQHGILARNAVAGRAYSLDGSTGTPWVGMELTNQFILDIFNSNEARQWRDSEEADSVKGVNKRLAVKPSDYEPVAEVNGKITLWRTK
jgi:murein DD-endopeptidase MepM/ murein hydrolase activator NlpD